jgi:histidinol-phosphatase (PHP family)
MSIPCDYHLHTHFSADSQASVPDMCEAAIGRGLTEICLTEHVDWIPWDETREHFNASAYVSAAQRCQSEYAGRLSVRIGLEASEPHLVAGEIKALLEAWPFDFVLGSAHWIDQSGIYLTEIYRTHPIEHVEREYFQRVLELSEQGEFDSLGHLDLVRRYRPKELGPFDTMVHADIIRAILRTLVERDKAFEINTSPLRRGLDSTCPDLTVLRWYKELGGEKLTIGSDAHRPDQVGTGFDVALDMLKAAGFQRICAFSRRQPQWVSV